MGTISFIIILSTIFYFYFFMSTQEKGEEKFKPVTSASLDIVHSRLNYTLGTILFTN
jgi:hypothetical protein